MAEQVEAPITDLTIDRVTAGVNLRLVTPRGTSEGLALLGLTWEPRPATSPELQAGQSGLYAWCDGQGDPADDLLDRPVLYFGVGEGVEGVLGRLKNELGWLKGAGHAHGIAMTRRNAAAVVGAVTPKKPAPPLDWLTELPSRADVSERAPEKVRRWLQGPGSDLKKAEQFAIRFSIHAGDVVSPVNSQFASAWNYNHQGADWAAWCAALHLRVEDAHPSAVPTSPAD